MGGELRVGRAVLGGYRRLAGELFVSVESVVEVLGGGWQGDRNAAGVECPGGRSPRSWKRGNSFCEPDGLGSMPQFRLVILVW